MFMGTPEFSLSTLEALKDSGYDVETIITQPDKPKNRGQKMSHPPVYDYAVENSIKVFIKILVNMTEVVTFTMLKSS